MNRSTLCECGAPMATLKTGEPICSKTADKYAATYGQSITAAVAKLEANRFDLSTLTPDERATLAKP